MKQTIEELELKFDEYHANQLKLSDVKSPEYYLMMGKANAIGEAIDLLKESKLKSKLEKIIYLFPEVETISFDRNLDIVCKKKNGGIILCANFKELKDELQA